MGITIFFLGVFNESIFEYNHLNIGDIDTIRVIVKKKRFGRI